MKQPGSYFEIAELITKLLEGELSQDEAEKLKVWIAEDEKHQQIWLRMTDPAYLEKRLPYWKNKEPDAYWEALNAELSRKSSTKQVAFRKAMKYAAIILPALLILGTGWYLFGQKGQKDPPVEQTGAFADIHILPKGKMAKLVLANGKVIRLSGNLHQAITEKDGTKVSNHGGTLHYLSALRQAHGDEGKVIYNLLITPRGGEYKIVLADGTKVWLNAASKLRFPTQFNGKERKVYLSGEAYFEIAPLTPKGEIRKPFIVSTERMDITVLGTKFNVSAYADDKKQIATLAEGSVKVIPFSSPGERQGLPASHTGVRLKPGYEAVVTNSSKIQVHQANIQAALAWKNGLFIFNSKTLSYIMRTLSRWYDVDVKYENDVDTLLHFTGRIHKYENITGILKKLEMTGKIQFDVKGREVRVFPYQEKSETWR